MKRTVWTDAELQTLRRLYPQGGAKAVGAALNGTKTLEAIRKQAHRDGVHVINKIRNPRWLSGMSDSHRHRLQMEEDSFQLEHIAINEVLP